MVSYFLKKTKGGDNMFKGLKGFMKDVFRKYVEVEYIQGNAHEFSELRFKSGEDMYIESAGENGYLMLSRMVPLEEYKLKVKEIDFMENVERNRSLGKAAVGALAGTLFAGLGGAIIGGAIGGRQKVKDRSTIYIYGTIEEKPFECLVRGDLETLRKIQDLYILEEVEV
jgi:hypothetical protein